MPTINAKQVVLMILAALSFTATGISAMEAVIGATAVKSVGAVCTFVGGLMAAALSPFLSNTNTVKDAGAIDGVQVNVSREAPQQIAALAVAPENNGIAPARGEEVAVQQKAMVA